MQSNRFICLVFLLFIIGMPLQAQQVKREPLRFVLQKLQHQFKVVFTFADDWIAGIEVEMPASKNSLQATLTHLSKQTNLAFQILDSRYIVISKSSIKVNDSLCATVHSAETGEPLPGATVQLNQAFTTTNPSGYFQLSASSGQLVIRMLGFEPLLLAADSVQGDCATLFLKPDFTMLHEVTVTDVIASGIEERADGTITLRPEILGILPGHPQPDALQTLQYLPGVKSIAEASADLNIRGGTNDQNLVLLDGIRVYQTGHFFGLISGLNPHVISKVSLIKNGTSAYYGEGASGTIVIQAEDQVNRKLSGSAGVNLLYTDANVHVPFTKKLSIQLAARRSLPSVWQTPTYKQYFKRAFSYTEVANPSNTIAQSQDFNFFDTHVKLLYDATPRDKVRATFFNVTNLLEYEERAQGITPDQRKSTLRQNSYGSSLTHTRLWTDKIKTNLEGFISGYSLDAVNQNTLANQQLTQGNQILDAGMRLSAFWNAHPQLLVTTGYQFFESGITNSDAINIPVFSRLSKEVNRTHAVFTEATFYDKQERTQVRFGLRANHYSKPNTFRAEPRLVLNRKIGKYFSAEVQGEMKTQTSVQVIDLQNDFLGVEKRRWLLSNGSDVPILQSRQVSTGLNFNKGKWLVSADLFYKNVDGVITSSQGFQNQFQNVRTTGNYFTQGVDILTNYKHSKFNSWLSYSVSRSVYRFSDLIPPSFLNNLDIRHSLNGGVGYRVKQLEVSCGANWHSGRPTTVVLDNEVISGVINYDSPNAVSLKNYFRVDVSASWYFYLGKSINSHAGVSLWNVLDRRNILNQHYQLIEFSQLSTIQQPGLGFTPNLFLRVNF